MDILGILLGFICVGTFVAVLGHGLWLLAAAVGRFLSNDRLPRSWEKTCPGCGARQSIDYKICSVCGLATRGEQQTELTELTNAARLVSRLCERGSLDRDTANRVEEALLARRREILSPPVAPARPAVAPTPALAPPPAVLPPLIAPPTREEILDVLPVRPVRTPQPTSQVQSAEQPPPPTAPPKPRRSMANVLAAFMENRNILWGELVGGLLIVGCSIALVLSLWQTLEEEVRYFPFLLFSAITAALFGAGQYTLHHWKLESTSRGLLVIALLLTPLNLLVLGDPEAVGRVSGPIDFAVKLAALLGFTVLARKAGRDLISADVPIRNRLDRRWLVAIGVVGVVAAPLLGSGLLESGHPEYILLLGGISQIALGTALFCFPKVSAREARSAFTLIGLSSFAAAVTPAFLVFLVYRLANARLAFHYLGVLLPLSGWLILANGLRLRRGMEDNPGQESAGWRTAATAVGVAGLAVMLAGEMLAWPAWGILIAASAINGVLLTALAFHGPYPRLHAAALPCLALLAVLGYHYSAGNLSDDAVNLVRLLATPESGTVLAICMVALVAASEGLIRLGRGADADAYSFGAAGAALLALVPVTVEGMHRPATAAAVYASCAACGMVSNNRWRRPGLAYTWLGLALIASLWTLQWKAPKQWPIWALVASVESALLAFASLRANAARNGRAWREMSIAVGGLAILLIAIQPVAPLTHGATAAALAVAALIMALSDRSQAWFAVFQTAVTAAVLFGVNAWLRIRGWQDDPLDPRALQTYGIGLGVFSMAWLVTRLVLRRSQVAIDLGLTSITVDRVVLAGLVIGQFLLAAVGVAPGVVAELTPRQAFVLPAGVIFAYGTAAWLLVGVLTFVLAVSLWEHARTSVLLGLTLLAVTVPLLVAGPFGADLATASALRWGLAACFLSLCSLVWARDPVGRLAGIAGIRVPPEMQAAGAVRACLDVIAIAVLGLTLWVATLGFAGRTPPGPLAESFFARIGWTASAITPLALLVLGLAGHAIRERSPVYAFVAGLVANVAIVGGLALEIVTAGGRIGEIEAVRLAQTAALAAAVWGLVWILVRQWLYTRRGSASIVFPATARPLLALQMALALGGNLILLGGAVAVRGNVLVDPAPVRWSTEAGSPLGAAALLTALAAFVVWHRQSGESLSWQTPFFTGLMVPILLACAAERSWPGAGPRVLLFAWPAYLLLWSLGALRTGWRRRLMPGVSFNDVELPIAVALASLFTIVVAAKSVWFLETYPAAALSSVLTAVSFAVLAVARRTEGLAFAAALLGNVAVSLIVTQHYHDTDFTHWVVPLARANVAASALGALVWLALRRRLREPVTAGPLLAVQATLGLGLGAILLLEPLRRLLIEPAAPLPNWLWPEYPGNGLPALLLAVIAAFWHRQQASPDQRLDVLGLFGLSLGVLLACFAAPRDTGNWLSYHVLTVAWAVLGLTGVAAGSVVYALRVSGVSASENEPQARWFAEFLPAHRVRRWVEISGGLLAVLALRGGWTDPYRPYPSAITLLLVSVMAAALAMWFGRARHVWASGLLLNLVGIVLWVARGPATLDSFLLTNAIGLAVAAAFWTAVALVLPGNDLPLGRSRPPFAHFAASVAWALVICVVVLQLSTDFSGGSFLESSLLAWPAVLVVGIALAVAIGDRSARWPLPGIYGLGLAAVGLALHDARLESATLVRVGTLSVAAYILLAGFVRKALSSQFFSYLRLPVRDAGWFAPVQLAGAWAVVASSAWISVSFARVGDRLTGALAVALVVPAAGLLGASGRRMTLALAALALADVALALPDPFSLSPWLHRSALLLAAFAATNLAFADGLPILMRRRPEWVDEGRRAGAILGVLSGIVLLFLLGQEFRLFDPTTKRTPLEPWLVALVPFCILAMMSSAVRCAVQPSRDPLGLSERGRGLYVYAVEVLLVLLFLHVRLNVPELFTGWAGKFWPLIVMAIAFAGVGLAEFFDRLGHRVLVGPLRRTGVFLPLLPLVAFWARPPQAFLEFAAVRLPGAVPMLTYLHSLSPQFDRYALLWLLVGLLYAWQALTQRSFRFGIFAALAGNLGIWSLLVHGGIPFLAHPQMWLIPLALIVLVSEHINRERLPAEIAAGLRYLGICLVYVSSTAELFITGIGHSVILPITLALLSVCGVLAGIVLRVRAFLFLGVSFLLLDILTMIWHAGDRYHTWIWWVSGIVLGAAILAVFAVFEKRRNDVLWLIDQLKGWK